MIPDEKLDQIRGRFEFLEARLNAGAAVADLAVLSREYAELKPIVGEIDAWRALVREREEAERLLGDAEMRGLAQEELERIREALPEAERAVQLALLPKDAADERSAILEIRAGTGGEEAALFAADLARMYQRLAEAHGWRWEVIEAAPTELGGFRELVAEVRGKGVFAALKFESGVHRVQRVPVTESGGRIHTSAATVAVLPEAEEVDVEIPAQDIRIDTMRASGAGGQHVNTTDSAVRITHLPTGIVVTSSEKSQHQNRARAMEVLRAKLFDMERQKRDGERAAGRQGRVGTGDRSERVRADELPAGGLADPRIGLPLYKLDQVMLGDFAEVIEALTAADQAARLADLQA
jgi:peptide chain release factor 1